MRINNRMMPWLNWSITTAFVLCQFFLQAATGLMANSWQLDFQLTSTQVGYLSASFFISYVVMQIPAGLAYDRFSARRILSLSSTLLCLGTLGLAVSQQFWQALVARMIMGFGSSYGFIGMLYITSSWFSKRYFALLVGLSEMLAMIGIAINEIIMAWIIDRYGWRMMMLIAVAIMFLINIMILGIVRDRQSNKKIVVAPVSIFAAVKKVAISPYVWLAGLYGFAMFSIINVVVNLWGVPFFTEQYPSLSLNIIGSMMSMIFIGTAIGALFNGWLIQYTQKRPVIMISFVLVTTLLFGLILYIPHQPLWCLFLLLFFLGFFSSTYIQVFAIVKDNVTIKLQATALAATNMILMASAPILQPLIGSLLEHNYSFPQALTSIELTLVIATILSFYLDKKIN
jgi:MFS family permease